MPLVVGKVLYFVLATARVPGHFVVVVAAVVVVLTTTSVFSTLQMLAAEQWI